jgi:murein DD-endopeptidase MepM/ murein hydrolase activator NlpD
MPPGIALANPPVERWIGMGFAGVGSFKFVLALTPALLAAAWEQWDPVPEDEPSQAAVEPAQEAVPKPGPQAMDERAQQLVVERVSPRSQAPATPWSSLPLTQGVLEDTGGEDLPVVSASHRYRDGRVEWYEHIPLHASRPSAYDVYRYPVPMQRELMVSGYDLDRPNAQQRRGPRHHYVGHGAIDIAGARWTRVRLVPLEHQVGDAEVLFAGHLFGKTVITRHTVREGGKLREYVVLYSHLAGYAAIRRGRTIQEGGVLGYVGDSGSKHGGVHLHLEVRRVRDGIDSAAVAATRLIKNEVAIVCDPRNLLPLR